MVDNTGGPAFPDAAFGGTRNEQQGMTLRDYFAAKAMQGMMANPNLIAKGAFNEGNFKMAYQAADAMLRAREAA